MSSGNKASSGGQRAKNAGNSHRIPRVEREIREVVGSYLLSGFRGDLPGLVSVSRVVASKDLRTAKILIIAIGEDVDREACVRELQAHAHEVQQAVNQRLRMKHCPRLSFHYDTGYEHAMKVEGILRNLERERHQQNEAPVDEEPTDSNDSED